MAYPTLPEVKVYLGAAAQTYTDAAITAALTAETAAQAAVCRIPAAAGDPPEVTLPDDLEEALMRRVARNLAMRRLPLGVQTSETATTPLGTNDPEVRRLERPHRKVRVG